MKCNHKYIYLDKWLGSKKNKIPDKWVFYCEKCLEIVLQDMSMNCFGEFKK